MSENPVPAAPLEYAPPPQGPMSVLAILSLSLGIVATPLDYACEIGLIFGLAAVLLGLIALRRIRTRGQRGRGMALAGVILGSIALLVGIGCGLMLIYSFRTV